LYNIPELDILSLMEGNLISLKEDSKSKLLVKQTKLLFLMLFIHNFETVVE